LDSAFLFPHLPSGNTCFVRKKTHYTKEFSDTDIININKFLIDNIFAMFGGRVLQQAIGIPMGTHCDPLLANLFLYSYEADFIHRLLKKNEKNLAPSFNFTFCYIDDVLSLNNSWFGDFVDRIYPIELEIKDFLVKGLLLTRKLLNQWYLLVKWKSSLRMFDCRHHDLVDRYGISVSHMTTDTFYL
jgi:hypothetical protein